MPDVAATATGPFELQDGVLSVPYRAELNISYTYSNATSLPDGLQLGNASIKGIPKVFGLFNISLLATFKNKTIQQTFSLMIKGMELVVSGNSTIFISKFSTFLLAIQGGIPPVNLSIESDPDFCEFKDYTMVCKPMK